MKPLRLLSASALLLSSGFAEEWKPLFNGRDLGGWSGDPRLWRVEDGVLIGETDARDRKISANSFLIRKGGESADFELEFKARITGNNNSGVQYRSKVLDAASWSVGGYQFDLHPAPDYLGMLYEERGRGIACESGRIVELTDQPKTIGSLERFPINLAEWNEYRVVARGSILRHFVNGKPIAEIRDMETSKRALKGVIALQLHAGPAMKAEFKEIRLKEIPVSSPAKASEPDINWIWKSGIPSAGQKVFFRRAFEAPANVESASVTITCDNWRRLWVNGRDFGISGDWRTPADHDVTAAFIAGGENLIAIEARNQDGPAGLAFRLKLTHKDGTKIFLVSDEKWLCHSESAAAWKELAFSTTDWKPAAIIGKMGASPWGEVIQPDIGAGVSPVDVTGRFETLPGFKVERLYQIPGAQGSWVAMTVDGEGRLLCADQYGKIYRVTPTAEPDGETEVVPTSIPLSGAHGLLWHKGTLWISVNEGSDPSGVWRVTERDGKFGAPELVKAMQGRGEHGPHGFAASPDGEWIYFVAGNFTDLPEMDVSLPARIWEEDQLLPRRPDAKGHAHDRMAPGGWIARFRPDGRDWELFAMGFRNAYGIAFNSHGDLFTYDSDMEWDLGMPWYRPTRINHVIPGSEFGWRNGSGVWPDYYEDSMFSQLDIGPGSPTGVLSGRGTKFPGKYQEALFALDWTYATIHAIHLTPEGRGYRAERENFLAGSGLPVTDAVIGGDGAMYFLTGGRRTASALWRISYAGNESTQPVSFESKPLGLSPLPPAWEGLGSADRLTRYESRLALETAGPETLARRLSRETDAWKTIGASLALARVGNGSHRSTILEALLRADWSALDTQQRLNWLRAAGLIFARHGFPAEDERAKILAKIDSAFPSGHRDENRELCRMLAYLQAPGIVGRTLALMDTTGPSPAPDWLAVARRNPHYGGTVERMIANLPPEQIIHYIYCLRAVKGPWTKDERKRFFVWFDRLLEKSGGESYAGFIRDLRKETLGTATEEEREWLLALPTVATAHPLANLPPVQGPGREWTIVEVEKLASEGLSGRDPEKGRKMYQAALCAACHRFNGEGGSAGPDLTAVAGRFGIRDLAEAIIEPGKVISDQYAFDLIAKHDGSQLAGKLIEEKDEHWIVAVNPFDFSDTLSIERNTIKDIRPSPISPMPAGLINRLNSDELKDLLAYLLGK